MPGPTQPLTPLAYHLELRDYLKQHEPKLWEWFSSAKAQSDYTESLRLDLLKQTYRLDAGAHAELFEQADAAKAKIGLDIPLTIYQSQQSHERNASLYYIPGEAHIVLDGQILALLNPAELRSLLGHELAHYLLWQHEDGGVLIADRIINAVARDARAAPSYFQSARRLQLYTEIYADRGSFLASEDVNAVVSNLVKLITGLQQVSAESYIKQAEEIFSRTDVTTNELSHPESFIRARALVLWVEGKPNAQEEIQRMIEGPLALDTLDLFGQQRLTLLTRRFLQSYLKPHWFQTQTVLGHARLFFDDFQPAGEDEKDETLMNELRFTDPKLQEYICYLLLDFATREPELEQVPLAAAFTLAGRLDLGPKLEEIVRKELKLTKRALNKIQSEAEKTLELAAASAKVEE